MRRALLLVVLWLWLWLVVGCGRLSYDLRLPGETIVLANGVRVVVLPDDTADLVAAGVLCRVDAIATLGW